MADQGLGSPNMDEAKKKEIQSKGGMATGGKNLSRAARSKGGKSSHSNQYT
jgi:general stress protein YciG